MKRVPTITFIVLLFIAASALPAQTLDEIVAKNYQTRGGLDKLEAMKSMIVTGKMTFALQGGMEMPLTVWQKSPNKMRIESDYQGQKITQGYDGKVAWWIMPMLGPDAQELTGDQAEQIKEMADFDNPLIMFKKRGEKLELVGKEEMEGTPVLKLKLTRANGKDYFFYLDADSGIELKTAYYNKSGQTESLVEVIAGDYKPLNGLVLPYFQEVRVNGSVQMRMTFDQIELNPVIDDQMFAMPPKKEAPAQPQK